jgi:hypothetical protein
MADRDGVSYQKKPPYFFLEGWNFKSRDIADVSIYLEERTGLSTSLFYLPDFCTARNPLFIKGLSFNNDEWPDAQNIIEKTDTSVVDLHINAESEDKFLSGFNNFISTCNPHRLYNIVLYSDSVVDNAKLFEILSRNENDNYYRRINLYTGYSDGSIFHFFQVTEKPEVYNTIISSTAMITPLFRVNKKTVSLLPVSGGEDLSLLIEKGEYRRVKNFLKKFYSEDFQHVAFMDEEEMQQFYSDIKQDYVKLPYSFGIKNITSP